MSADDDFSIMEESLVLDAAKLLFSVLTELKAIAGQRNMRIALYACAMMMAERQKRSEFADQFEADRALAEKMTNRITAIAVEKERKETDNGNN